MVQDRTLRFSVGSSPFATPRELVELSVNAETLGLYGVCVADHPGITPSPFVRLALAATATTRLRLIPYVLNCGVRDPFDIASGDPGRNSPTAAWSWVSELGTHPWNGQ